jgi:crotonobetainyl-CoA:carnitine CoA-transferase CaiB-like acyl-CoA transferase
MIAGSDVLITNFKEGDAEKFGLGFATVSSWNQNLIYAHIRGFVSDPDRVAYDVVLQAETGFMSMNGTQESGPLKMPVALIDVLAAHQLKEGILCALIAREHDGVGSYVEVSLEQAAISSLVNQASNFLMEGYLAGLSGSLHPNIAPYGETFNCSDNRLIVLAVGSDKQFESLCVVLGADDLISKTEFATNPDRVKNRTSLSEQLSHFFRKFESENLIAELTSRHVPCGIIRNMDEVMQTARKQNMILDEVINDTPTSRVSGVAFRLSR